MSARYECGKATETPLSVLSGREAVEQQVLYPSEARNGEHALIIGDPWASAYAVTGTRAELREFTTRLAALAARLCPATVAELTDDHVGWLVKVTEPDPVFRYREFVLIGVRKWTHAGQDKVGLTAPREGWAGEERIYPAETPCELVRQVRKPRRKKARQGSA